MHGLIGKLLTFAVSQESGFVGGPIFPSLFVGGTAGVIVHQVIPGVPAICTRSSKDCAGPLSSAPTPRPVPGSP
jgi:H+/Cl- antiporter ClcA